MEPEKASTRMKTKKTKMFLKYVLQQKFYFEFENLNLKCNQSNDCIFCIQSGYRGTVTLAFNWVSFSVLENKQVRRSFFSVLFMPYNKSFIDQASSVKMAGYWPRSLFTFLWTSTSSRSIKTQKENSANIQPS